MDVTHGFTSKKRCSRGLRLVFSVFPTRYKPHDAIQMLFGVASPNNQGRFNLISTYKTPIHQFPKIILSGTPWNT